MTNEQQAGCLFHFDNAFPPDQAHYGGINLYQFGEIACECGHIIPAHMQSCLELSYIVSGTGSFYINDDCIMVKEGDIVCNAIGHRHAIKADRSSMLRFVYMGFVFTDSASEEMHDIQSYFQSVPYRHASGADHLMVPFFRNIDEFFSQKPYSHMLIRNCLEEIIILSYRSFREKETGKAVRYSPDKWGHSVGSTVYSIIRYVENHIYELKTIRSIADELGYSYTYLSHTFKNKTGMTLQRYINHKKIEKALEMLKFGNLTVKQTAERLNYETIQSFSKAFSRIMGYPPSQYVAMQRKESRMRQDHA